MAATRNRRSASSAAAVRRTSGSTRRRTRRRTGCGPSHWSSGVPAARRRRATRRRIAPGGHLPRRRTTNRCGTMIMPARRRGRRTPRVDDSHRVDDGRLRRLDARPVAMRADRRAVGVLDDARAVADRTERTVDIIAVHPRAGVYATGHEGRKRQNRKNCLVHDPPAFLAVCKESGESRRKT